MLENILLASYTARHEKLPILQHESMKFDALKFFLALAWELKYIDTKKYATLSTPLTDVGKMLGKWIASVKEHS